MLLDSKNPERQHSCGRVEKRRPPGPRAERLADGSFLVIVTHDLLGIRREPRQRRINHDEHCVRHFAEAVIRFT